MMKHIVNVGIVLIAVGLATACGSTNENLEGETSWETPDGEDTEESPAAMQAEELHAFEVAETRFTIMEVDGELLTTFSHPRQAPVPRVVSATGERLTLLETYLALQPEGVPDQRLLDDHVLAAERLGREDASVHAGSVELISTVEKGAAEREECIIVAAGFTGGTFVAPHYTKSGEIAFLNGTFTSARPAFPQGERGDMLLEACNFNAGAQTETVQFQKKTGTGPFITQFTSAIAANNANGIIQNTGNGFTRFNLRIRVTTTPNVPMVGGVFGEARP